MIKLWFAEIKSINDNKVIKKQITTVKGVCSSFMIRYYIFELIVVTVIYFVCYIIIIIIMSIFSQFSTVREQIK